MNDLRYAFRHLLKSPAFSLIAILTLALGIGANSAIFSVIDAVLLRPLPFSEPDRIVMVWARYTNDGGSYRTGVHSYLDFVDLKEQSGSFEATAAYTRTEGALSGAADAQLLEGVAVTSGIFDVLGVPPLLGRGFTEEEAKAGGDGVVLTYPAWQRIFGGDRSVLGRKVNISGRPWTVIGVMPPNWKFPVEDEKIDYVAPLQTIAASALANRGSHFLSLVGRLKPGVELAAAEAETSAIAARLAREYPDTNAKFYATKVLTLHRDVVGDVRPALIILFGAVGFVLLIACANVTNLLLVRAAAREREIAIRTALGASRQRIIRQLLLESLVLAALGGLGSLLLASWSVVWLGAAGLQGLPHLGPVQINLPVALFAFTLALGSTMLFGLVPALQLSRPNVNEMLRQGARGSSAGAHAGRLRAFFVVSQVSLSLLLLVSAGLLIKSFFNLRATSPGFNAESTVTTSITLPRVRYAEPDAQIRVHQAIMEKIAALPGVRAAGAADPLPFSNNSASLSFAVSGMASTPRGDHPAASYLVVQPDYFQAMQIPVRRGRVFGREVTRDSPLVIAINEAFARQFFPGRHPIGQHVMIDRPENQAPPCQVVAVVGDSRHDSLANETGPEMYVPFVQDPSRTLDYILRINRAELLGLQGSVKRAVQSVDKDFFVRPLRPMGELVATQLAQPRFNMLLLGVFAGVAMFLAAIGIYGVIAYGVAQRTREIGIRMTLGAQRSQMLGMIMRQSGMLVAIGLAIGLLATLLATRVIVSLLYGVAAADPRIYLLAVALLGGTALLASYFPARRAMKVDPINALRHE
ncbi:MAG TPA: ABC transporter permease [Chthoniobacterales bacterium]|jgi:putative ABC transport system permease protein|nr:ABC transporter permease [Chthoniobacterales bacterium]